MQTNNPTCEAQITESLQRQTTLRLTVFALKNNCNPSLHFTQASRPHSRRRDVLPDATEIEYIHGIGGQRLAKKVGGSITEKYLWSGVNLLAIYDSSNALVTRFNADGSITHNGTRYYLAKDQVGSLRAIYNASGVLQGEITYDSFGNELTNTIPGTLDIPIGFANGYSDRDTGLVRFGFRDYHPEVGRWTAKDPIFFAGGQNNIYAYVNNNPVMFVDPWGLSGYIELYSDPDYNGDYNAGAQPASSESVGLMESAAIWTQNALAAGVLIFSPIDEVVLLEKVAKSASALSKGEKLTSCGRALQKHANRSGSWFPKVKGNEDAWNEKAMEIVEDFLTDPKSTITKNKINSRYKGITFDITSPKGPGIRVDSDGNFIGFLEP